MFKLMMESLMEGERDAFLGYKKYDTGTKDTANSRNGYYDRDLLTGLGNLASLSVPRDRLGEFASEFIRTYEGSTKPMDKLILKLYAKGLSTRDITDTIRELYGKDLSPQAVTLITQEVEDERNAWHKRRLGSRYTVLIIDALFVKIRRDTVSSDAVYTVSGVTHEGKREILGQYVGTSESSTFWKSILQDIKSRGVAEVLLFVFDGLTGLKEVVNEVYPHALTQHCVVHQIRGTLAKVRPTHKEQIASDLRTIYQSKTPHEAKAQILELKKKWVTQYPHLFDSWLDKFDSLTTFMQFPEYLRSHLYSTNWLERMNKEFRKVLKTKNSFPTESSVLTVLYLKIKDLSKNWDTQSVNGFLAYQLDLQVLWERQYPNRKEVFTQSS